MAENNGRGVSVGTVLFLIFVMFLLGLFASPFFPRDFARRVLREIETAPVVPTPAREGCEIAEKTFDDPKIIEGVAKKSEDFRKTIKWTDLTPEAQQRFWRSINTTR